MVYSHNGMLLSNEREQTNDNTQQQGQSQECFVERNKLSVKNVYWMIPITWICRTSKTNAYGGKIVAMQTFEGMWVRTEWEGK